jgi:hypothetical protein
MFLLALTRFDLKFDAGMQDRRLQVVSGVRGPRFRLSDATATEKGERVV